MKPAVYLVLSLLQSTQELLAWWRPDERGCTAMLDLTGRYSEQQIEARQDELDNGETTLAVPMVRAYEVSARVVAGRPDVVARLRAIAEAYR